MVVRRLNAVWALKNLTHDCGEAVHVALVQELSWSTFRSLLADSEAGVQEQAMALLQNLCKGGEGSIQKVCDQDSCSIMMTRAYSVTVCLACRVVGQSCMHAGCLANLTLAEHDPPAVVAAVVKGAPYSCP